MNTLDDIIKKINLVFTKTLTREELQKIDFLEDDTVNYDNCVSLYEAMKTFNKLHTEFKKEYNDLEKLYLGKNIEVMEFDKKTINNNIYRSLLIHILLPKSMYLYLREVNDKVDSYMTNSLDFYPSKDFYRERMVFDENIVRGYLDLFEKYQPLLDFYNNYRFAHIYGDGSHNLFSKINSKNNAFLDDIDSFSISIGSSYFLDSSDYIIINMNPDGSINLDNSKLELTDKIIDTNEKIYENILNEIYINKNLLDNMLLKKNAYSFDKLLELEEKIGKEKVYKLSK